MLWSFCFLSALSTEHGDIKDQVRSSWVFFPLWPHGCLAPVVSVQGFSVWGKVSVHFVGIKKTNPSDLVMRSCPEHHH